MLDILIVDSNILFREGLSNLLRNEPGIRVVGEAGSICEAVEIVRDQQPDLILMDADLPDIREVNGIRLMRSKCAHTKVVLLSLMESDEIFLYAVRNGARGYICKNLSISTLMASIRAIERGEAVIPRALVGKLLDELYRMIPATDMDGLQLLTRREIEVLQELGAGRSNREIAVMLNIAENTVKVHVHNILEKLNLRNRRQAARYARCQGHIIQSIGVNSLNQPADFHLENSFSAAFRI